jgi:sulfate adenylyltransferase (ADP) / ATP adenylyltransferase
LLLITQEECSQLLPIKRKEFALGLSTIRALGRPSLIFFNRGPHSGYSQNHRHLQIIPICDLFHTLKKI